MIEADRPLPEPYVLLVEDHPGDARLVRVMFDEAPPDALPKLRWCTTVSAALDTLRVEPGCATVLLDLHLPDSQGLGSIDALREVACHVPLVVLSGDDDEAVGIAAVVAGAQDYLVKGSFDSTLLRRALQYAAHRKQVETALFQRAMHDSLTGLPTRALLADRLGVALANARRSGGRGALLFVDLDRFKQVNDTHGHAVGDVVLQTVAARMRAALRASDTLARIGGDEFVALLPVIGHGADGESVVRKLKATFEEPVVSGVLELPVSASVGVAEFGADNADANAEVLLERADQAMYEAKRGAVSITAPRFAD